MKKFRQALITGASSGIGIALCEKLADQNIALLITGRNEAELKKLADRLKSKVAITFFAADLATEQGRNVLSTIIKENKPDLLINNAGFGLYGPAIEHAISQEEELLAVNCQAVLKGTLELAKIFKENHIQGTICNVASAVAFHVAPNMASYAASKAFVVQLSRALDMELRPYGIRVLASCPGMVATHFAERAGGDPKKISRQGSMTPEFAAEQIWHQIQTGKSIYIFDWKYRLGTFLSQFFPKEIVGNLIGKSILERLKK